MVAVRRHLLKLHVSGHTQERRVYLVVYTNLRKKNFDMVVEDILSLKNKKNSPISNSCNCTSDSREEDGMAMEKNSLDVSIKS